MTRIQVRGIVQGVGFRPWVYRLARAHGLSGRVWNHSEGVTIDAFGPEAALAAFLRELSAHPPPAAHITALEATPLDSEPQEAPGEFRIVESRVAGERRVSIPADLATCSACVAEIFAVDNRRYRYPFTNCTDCGPRFTIATGVPYDRPQTTMAPFVMCAECAREYADPEDRRFHAQPNACPVCGPRLSLDGPLDGPLAGPLAADGTDDDAIRRAARAIVAGHIVAVKGIGGFHLVCDATVSTAALRARKRRDEKPFAVMVRDLAAAEALAVLSDAERALLTSIERPIVLVPRRLDAPIARDVAPDNPLVGLMLPYSPLHHLLLADAARPLVMTSGNLSAEPIAHRNDDARARLAGIADLWLLHDRDIETPCDDSVTRVIGDKPVVFRRGRGYVPRAIAVGRGFRRPVLACGAHLKNAVCIGAGDSATFGPHVGDLDDVKTMDAYEKSITRLERFLGVVPEIIAHDLHPGYLSTVYAKRRKEPLKIAVQHHHAHVAAAMAEHHLTGPVLGVAYDGTGDGGDGTAWGGELLLCDYARALRLATMRPISLPGGERAIRQVWRQALALLDDAFAGDPPLSALALFSALPKERLAFVRKMIAEDVQTPRAHGVGRYFDAMGAIILGRREARDEGQVALALNLCADPGESGLYPFAIDEAPTPWQLDLRPLVRAAVNDKLAGMSSGVISARFHNTLALATAELVRMLACRHGRLPVVLSGGCFQNARLAQATSHALASDFEVFSHARTPPGDGGIALGQAVVADAIARGL